MTSRRLEIGDDLCPRHITRAPRIEIASRSRSSDAMAAVKQVAEPERVRGDRIALQCQTEGKPTFSMP
jgi:hypothetical protein